MKGAGGNNIDARRPTKLFKISNPILESCYSVATALPSAKFCLGSPRSILRLGRSTLCPKTPRLAVSLSHCGVGLRWPWPLVLLNLIKLTAPMEGTELAESWDEKVLRHSTFSWTWGWMG